MESEHASVSTDLANVDAATSALHVFFGIAKAWGLSDAEQMTLLGVDAMALTSFRASKVNSRLEDATMERLSHIFAIYAALQVLLPIPERADTWIRRPNSAPLFGGSTALDRMMGGQVSDLSIVRQYLDAQLYC